MPPKRPRADSKLDNLPAEKFNALRDGLLNRTFRTQGEAREWVARECGFTVSAAAMSAFCARHCAPAVAARAVEPPSTAATLDRLLEAMERLTVAVQENTEERRRSRE